MDSNKTMAKYVKPTTWTYGFAWVFAGLGVFSFLGGVFSSHSSDEIGASVVGFLFFMMMAFCFFIIGFAPQSAYKKCLKRLEALGELERACEEINSLGCMTVGKDRGKLTAHYLYGKKTGIVVRYEDILWCYRKIQRYNFVAVNSYLMVGTAFCKMQTAITMGKNDKNDEIPQAMMYIAQRNPNVLFGFTNENNKAYKAKLKEAQYN